MVGVTLVVMDALSYAGACRNRERTVSVGFASIVELFVLNCLSGVREQETLLRTWDLARDVATLRGVGFRSQICLTFILTGSPCDH